ncbi:alpha/beta-hydrolase [Atractiella rhizophila]|nr:alpha/beta-hydrolase [Atractiella rhizophila]
MWSLLLSCTAAYAAAQRPYIPKDSSFTIQKDNSMGQWSLGGDEVSTAFYHPAFPQHAMRLASPKDVCPSSANQWVGYFDVANKSHHIFFWYFESQNDPVNDPVLLWFAGGPGSSGMMPTFGGLGPCLFAEDGESVYKNPYSWISKANLIIMDQPVGVGFSYFDEGSPAVSDSFAAAEDMYSFMQLFYVAFPDKILNRFVVAGGSYGGSYVPAFAAHLWHQNQLLSLSRQSVGVVRIPLESIMIGFGMTNLKVQTPSVAEYICDKPKNNGLVSERECAIMKAQASLCSAGLQQCIDFDFTDQACEPTAIFCDHAMFGPVATKNISLYNLKVKCSPERCYSEEFYPLITLLNSNATRAKLDIIPKDILWAPIAFDVHQRFQTTWDMFHEHDKMLIPLVEDGIRLLTYIGDLDTICNYHGVFEWMRKLPTSFTSDFNAAVDRPIYFRSTNEPSGRMLKASARTVGQGAGNYSYVVLFDAGHGVVREQPEIALWMLERWLTNQPFDSPA